MNKPAPTTHREYRLSEMQRIQVPGAIEPSVNVRYSYIYTPVEIDGLFFIRDFDENFFEILLQEIDMAAAFSI